MAEYSMVEGRFDQTFRERAEQAGARVRSLWRAPGVTGTVIEGIECYLVEQSEVVVHTYNEGWEVFTPCEALDIDASVADALARCGFEGKPKAVEG